MKKRKFSKTGIALVGAMLVCLLICLCVLIPRGGPGGPEAEDLTDADTPDLKTVVNEGSPVMIYDKRTEAQALMAAYENGDLGNVTVFWADDSDLYANTPEEAREIYKLFKNIVVTGEAEAPDKIGKGGVAAEDVAWLSFSVADEGGCDYTLIGDSILAIGDADIGGDPDEEKEVEYCSVTGMEPLVKKLEQMKKEQ